MVAFHLPANSMLLLDLGAPQLFLANLRRHFFRLGTGCSTVASGFASLLHPARSQQTLKFLHPCHFKM